MAESHRNKAEEKVNSEKLSTNYEGVVNNALANEQPKLNDRMKHSRATSEEDITSSRADDLDGWTRQVRDYSIVQLA